jgi:hypothetical protein
VVGKGDGHGPDEGQGHNYDADDHHATGEWKCGNVVCLCGGGVLC